MVKLKVWSGCSKQESTVTGLPVKDSFKSQTFDSLAEGLTNVTVPLTVMDVTAFTGCAFIAAVPIVHNNSMHVLNIAFFMNLFV